MEYCGSSLKRVRCPLIGLSLVSLMPDREEGGDTHKIVRWSGCDEWSECGEFEIKPSSKLSLVSLLMPNIAEGGILISE